MIYKKKSNTLEFTKLMHFMQHNEPNRIVRFKMFPCMKPSLLLAPRIVNQSGALLFKNLAGYGIGPHIV